MKAKLLQFSVLVCVVMLLGISTSVVIQSSTPCANTGNCDSLPMLSVDNEAVGIFQNQKVLPPKIDLAFDISDSYVLGDEVSQEEKRIYVDLASQMLSAYEGETLFLQTPISSGKWGRTPPGEYEIWVKMRATRMSGGSGNDYYNLPNVPYAMFFYNSKVPKGAGYSLHGAYWHNNFGHVMSHGCVNMRQIDAEKIYNWATPRTAGSITHASATNTGTKIIIY